MNAKQDPEATILVARCPLAPGEGTIDVTPACLMNGEAILSTLLMPGVPMAVLVEQVKEMLSEFDGESVAERLGATSIEGIASFINAWVTTTSPTSPFIVEKKITDADIALHFFGIEPAVNFEDLGLAAPESDDDDAAAEESESEPTLEEFEAAIDRALGGLSGETSTGNRVRIMPLDPDMENDPEAQQMMREMLEAIVDQLDAKGPAEPTANEGPMPADKPVRYDVKGLDLDLSVPPRKPWWKRLFGR